MSQTRIGTSHFKNRAAAIEYYRKQQCDTAEVYRKIADGEIHLGPPNVSRGYRLRLDSDGRYELVKDYTVGSSELKWDYSNMPHDSLHMERGNWSARVMPLPNGRYEWTTWIGPPDKRVLHQRGEVKLKSSAMRAAKKKLFATDRAFPPSI